MIGKKLANRYEILERIGGGGMAIVYRALDTVLNRYVSVKVLRPEFVADEDFVRRFRREAQSAASLSHPNVVNIYDVGVEEETYFIVMEYINGKTLKEIIQERAPLPVAEAVEIAKQICAALQHAHEHQIVHRDIKPHNIMIGKDGHVKVTDFGIARAITSSTITHNGAVIGSVHYFSPEQARGAATDVKSDIYSLGVVLYEMLTGELPFSGETPISVALKHLQEHFVEPRQLNPKIPQSVENIILKALAKNPGVRYPSAKEMLDDLDQALHQPNVAKFSPPDPTAFTQPTIQIPAPALREHSSAGPANNGQPGAEPARSKKRSFWKTLGVVFLWLLVGAAGVAAGFLLVGKFLNVPEVTMPNLVGQPYEKAVEELKRYGFKEENIKRVDEPDPGEGNRPPMQAGYVFAQDPEADMRVKVNRMVTLKVSKGPQPVLMPNLMGYDEQTARQKLADLHLDLNTVKFITQPNDAPKGTVFQQVPNQQVQVLPGQTQIEVYISSGPELATVPDVRTLSVSDASAKIRDAGFQVGDISSDYSYTVDSGYVTKQDPLGGEKPKGSKINLWVSKGMPPDAKRLSERVTVRPTPGATVTITIRRKDARGLQTVVDSDKISEPKEYPVELILGPNMAGEIQVYQNGRLTDTKTIPYPQ